MKPVGVRPPAEEHFEAAYLWYEGRQAHLGNEFLFAIGSALIQVSQHPEVHPIIDSDVRRGRRRGLQPQAGPRRVRGVGPQYESRRPRSKPE